MRLYALHIFVKDLSIFLIFFASTKIKFLNNSTVYSGRQSWGDVLRGSVYFTVALALLNVIWVSIVYYGLRSKLKSILSTCNKFLIGALIHIPTLVIWWNNQDMSDYWTGNILALSLSTIVSATVYYLLNIRQKGD